MLHAENVVHLLNFAEMGNAEKDPFGNSYDDLVASAYLMLILTIPSIKCPFLLLLPNILPLPVSIFCLILNDGLAY